MREYEFVSTLLKRSGFQHTGIFCVRISSHESGRWFTIHAPEAFRIMVKKDSSNGSEYYSFEGGGRRFYTMMETLQFLSRPNSHTERINLRSLIGNITDLQLEDKLIGKGNSCKNKIIVFFQKI